MSESRVRENRMHGLTGGSWKRSTRPTTATEKNHPRRALQLRPPRPEGLVPKPIDGRVRRRPVLGGLINDYEPAA